MAIPIGLVLGPSLMTAGHQLTFILAVPSPVVVYLVAGIVEKMGATGSSTGRRNKVLYVAGKVILSAVIGVAIFGGIGAPMMK